MHTCIHVMSCIMLTFCFAAIIASHGWSRQGGRLVRIETNPTQTEMASSGDGQYERVTADVEQIKRQMDTMMEVLNRLANSTGGENRNNPSPQAQPGSGVDQNNGEEGFDDINEYARQRAGQRQSEPPRNEAPPREDQSGGTRLEELSKKVEGLSLQMKGGVVQSICESCWVIVECQQNLKCLIFRSLMGRGIRRCTFDSTQSQSRLPD